MFSKFSYQKLFGVLTLSTFLLGGCAYNPLSYAYDTTYPGFKDLVRDCNTEVDLKLNNSSAAANDNSAAQKKSGLNLFLDCVTGHVEVDDKNVQLRMLRAHGVVAMLANYGAMCEVRS